LRYAISAANLLPSRAQNPPVRLLSFSHTVPALARPLLLRSDFVCINHGPTTSLYYNDPDHNRIELQVDNFADMTEATALMQEQFSINPVGAEFDPEELLARLRSGADPAELVRPTKKPSPPTRELIAKIISS